MTPQAWRTIFDLTAFISFWGAVVHGFIGNPYTAATHVFIGTVAVAMRGACDE